MTALKCLLGTFLIVAIAVSAPESSFAQSQSAAFDPSRCALTALTTADNDVRREKDAREPGKPVDLPSIVEAAIRASAAGFLAELNAEAKGYLACKYFFSPVYRIAIEQRYLYVANVTANFGIGFYYLFLFDPRSNAITSAPPRIWSKWSEAFGANEALLTKQLVSSADLFKDGHHQIVFEERVHNGTMYNGVINHYFEVGPHLELRRVLALETNVLSLDPREGLYVRKFVSLSRTRLKLETFGPGNSDQTRQSRGFVILEAPAIGEPFHVLERHPSDSRYSDVLVTFSAGDGKPDDDDVFLRKGYTGYY